MLFYSDDKMLYFKYMYKIALHKIIVKAEKIRISPI